MSERHQGTVKFYNNARHFGYLMPDEGGDDIFVHVSAVRKCPDLYDDDMRKGQRLEYEIAMNSKRGGEPCAVRLKLIGDLIS